MSTFVLVHGAFHGAWCWERVVPMLATAGHRVVAVDLPGRNGDATQTLESYTAHVAAVVAAEAEAVVLVGHGMGGMVITAVAERLPERVGRLIYVCAYLPGNGDSLLDLAKTDDEGHLLRNLVIDDRFGLHWVRPEDARDAFFHDCSDEDAAAAAARLTKESLAVVITPVETTASRFGRVPRTYIECTGDRALGPSLQRRMHREQPCEVRSLPTSHSPFWAQPSALARVLLEAVESR